MILTDRHERLIKRLLFLLLPYSILRIGFYFYHFDLYKSFDVSEVLLSFVLGIRFDIAAICLVNALIIILSLIPTRNLKFLSFERVLFILLNTVAFIVAIDDYELFLFLGKRLSYDFFAITDDILEQLPQIILHYWYLPMVAILFGIGFYFFDRKFFTLNGKQGSVVSQSVMSVLILAIAFIGIRGGLQYKSINVQSAFVQGKNELGHLVLNSPYHFLRTLKNTSLKKLKYFSSDAEAKKYILSERKFENGVDGKQAANVVLIILESFSLEYVEEGYAPFLNELKNKGMSFNRHLANGRRSIEALPSLLCGLPSLFSEPISKSAYQGNKFNCLPKILKKSGYTNHFFHAGARGTMGFESYTLANGFDRYFSREDYGKTDFDGTWGIYDEPYLQYVVKNLNTIRGPFLAGIFTLSSHQPYSIPSQYKDKFQKGTLEIHESIGYADHALRKFFESAQKEEWFKNTLFIITSDHTQKLQSKKFLNMVGHYRVPLLMVGPGISTETINKVTQHSDIPRSVLDYLKIEDELPLTSGSVFAKEEGRAVNFADGATYFLSSGDRVYTLENEFAYNWETGEVGQMQKSESFLLKAYLQYFFNGLISNNLSLYR